MFSSWNSQIQEQHFELVVLNSEQEYVCLS